MYSYLKNLWNAFSQFLNVLLLNGSPNESLSSRAYAEPWPKTMWIINKVFFWQNNHCRGAFANELRLSEEYVRKAIEKGIYR